MRAGASITVMATVALAWLLQACTPTTQASAGRAAGETAMDMLAECAIYAVILGDCLGRH